MKILIQNGRVLDPETQRNEIADVLVEDGKIAAIGTNLRAEGVEVLDATGKLVIPGMIDLHVHLRDMDQAHKETIESGTRAALAGGVTTVFAMPNTSPPLDNKTSIQRYQKRIKESAQVNVHVIGAITQGLPGKALAKLEVYPELGIQFISDDGFDVEDEELLEQAYRKAKALGLILITHPEMHSIAPQGVINEGVVSRHLDLPGQPNEKEWRAVERGLRLIEKTGARGHFTHVSTRESVELLRQAKAKGLPVTCDSTPHHFSLTEEAVLTHGSLAKVNPPLRTEADRQAIIAGLKDGTIDLIATDHAPHSKQDKGEDLKQAAPGLSLLDTAMASILTELHFNQGIPLIEVIRLMTLAPAKLAHLKSGRLQVGAPAEIIIVDLDEERTVDWSRFYSKGKNTPFQGMRLRGWPLQTFI